MKNTFGSAVTVTLFGESHGPYIGAVLDGLAPGIKVDRAYISKALEKRRPYGALSTKRREPDEFIIASGEFNGFTTGTPLTVLIPNSCTKSEDYAALSKTPRPSHADYTAKCKYHGFQDFRGGGHFSGRITAALVAAGAILSSALLEKGIKIGTHIKKLAGICDRDIKSEDLDGLSDLPFPALCEKSAERMQEVIKEAAADGDSVGGVLESMITGIPTGVGEPWFDSLESVISHIVFSVPGVKGIEFGAGFGVADMRGSMANDAMFTDGQKVYTHTNNSGGICGGISNGMPIIFRTAVKPTPSIYKKQSTVNLDTMENTELEITGRHDPAIIHRAAPVINAVAAIAIADMLTVRFGTDYLSSK